MSVRFQIAAMLCIVISPVLFGIGLIIVLLTPALNADAILYIPTVIILSFMITPVIAWILAPRMRNRYWQQRKINHPTSNH